MSNKMRHLNEYEQPRMYPIASATDVERGDMVYFVRGTPTIAPASDFTWDTDLETTQRKFAKVYAGVAAQKSDVGDTDEVRVDTASVFAMACASATWEVGDKVAPAKASGNALEDQKVVATNRSSGMIGRVAKRAASAVTEVEVMLESRLQNTICCQTTTTTTTTTT